MPIRQPKGICTPAFSPASISDVAASAAMLLPLRANVTAPPSPVRRGLATPRIARDAVARRCPPRPTPARPASSIPCGPHAHVWRSRQSGHLVAQPAQVQAALRTGGSAHAIGSRVSRAPAQPAPPRTSRRIRLERQWMCRTSVIWSRRASVRSIDITGVMPEPAVRNSTDAGAGSGITKLPWGAASRTIVPGATPPTRWRGQEALRHRLDGDGDGARGLRLSPALPLRARGQRIRPPPPTAVDEQPDADVLTRLVVELEAPAGLDDQRRTIGRFPAGPRRSVRAVREPTTAGWRAAGSRREAAGW